MADRPSWAPLGVDLTVPSIARTWDYWLGGSHNFEVDRAVARATTALMPEAARMAQLSRCFLSRIVRHCVDAGITQFLDLGSGIPTVGNVHEVALSMRPDARIVYVDRDQVAVTHTESILAGHPNVGVLLADVRDADRILADPRTNELLDLSQPVAVLMIMVLHFIRDEEDPAGIVAAYRDAAAPGSMLGIAHGGRADPTPDGVMKTATETYERSVAQLALRSQPEIAAFFEGFELVDPGVVWLSQWRSDEPGDPPEQSTPLASYGGLGVKR